MWLRPSVWKPAVITPPTNLIKCCHGDGYSEAWGSGTKTRKSGNETCIEANCMLYLLRRILKRRHWARHVSYNFKLKKEKRKKKNILKNSNKSWILHYPREAALCSANQMWLLFFVKKQEGCSVCTSIHWVIIGITLNKIKDTMFGPPWSRKKM